LDDKTGWCKEITGMLGLGFVNEYTSNKMHSDCLCSSFHPNFSVKIYQLLKKMNIESSYFVRRYVYLLPPPILFVINTFQHMLQQKWHWHFCLLSM